MAKNSVSSGMRRRGRGQRVDGQQAQRGLAVDEDDVVVVHDRAQHPGEDLLAGHLADELHLGGRQVDVGRDEVEVPGTRVCTDDVADVVAALDQQVVDRDVEVIGC
jgi:hypothetical protein